MQLAVPFKELGGILGEARLGRQDVAQALYVRILAAAGRDARDFHLEGRARFLEVLQARRRMGQEVTDRVRHLVDHSTERGQRHPRPLTMADLHQAHAMQVLQGFADGRSPDGEACHQLAFGGQELIRPDLPALDHRQKPLLHRVGQLAPFNWNDVVHGFQIMGR